MKIKKKKIMIVVIGVLIFSSVGIYILYQLNYIPHKKYDSKHFGIQQYKSNYDQDMDGIDDQTDILESVRAYIEIEPKYKSKYYAGGYPDDEYGVCTDVVAFGLLDAGYDLMELVDEDVLAHGGDYNIDEPDRNIDFRRVVNLNVYFQNTAIELTTDIYEIEEWQGGDIVVFQGHVGIVSDMRNKNGVSFVIHHANPYQFHYEEDILESRDDIVGHYRIS